MIRNPAQTSSKKSFRPQASEWNAKIRPRNTKKPAATPTTAPRTSRFTLISISALASSISSRTSAEAFSEMRFTMSPIGASTSRSAVP